LSGIQNLTLVDNGAIFFGRHTSEFLHKKLLKSASHGSRLSLEEERHELVLQEGILPVVALDADVGPDKDLGKKSGGRDEMARIGLTLSCFFIRGRVPCKRD